MQARHVSEPAMVVPHRLQYRAAMNPTLLLMSGAALASPTHPVPALRFRPSAPPLARGPRPRLADRLVVLRRGASPRCPRCGSARVARWGRFGVRQRYRCRGCTRTFSDFTGTALSGLKRAELWPDFCRCIHDGLTVRQSAARLGVHRDTAFRWRHRLLRELRAAERHRLGPVLSVGETSVYARHRLLVALDDRGRASATRAPGRSASVGDLRRLLDGRLEDRAVLVSREGAFGVAARFAGETGLRWQRCRPIDRQFDPFIERPASYGVRFRRWIRRFRGVSARYMDNYLGWFRLHEGSLWNGLCRG